MSKFTIGLVSASLLLSACGGGNPGGGGTPGGATGPGPNAGAGTTLTRAQLANCPSLTGSRDPAAANCLVGTVIGKTVGGDVCKLVIKSNSGYEYSTAKLNYSYSYASQDYSYFDKAANYPLIIWNTYSNGQEYKSLDFKYGFSNDYEVQIDAEKDNVKSTCTARI